VLLLHGGGQTRHAWRRTGQWLGRAGWHALALDARGHGDSAWVENGDYSDGALARDLACVVQSLGDRRPVIVGASLGGITGMVAVSQGLVKASALILVDVVHSTAPAGFERVRGFMTDHAGGFLTLEEAVAAVARYQGGQGKTARPAGLAKNLRQGIDGRLYWHWDPRFLVGREDLAGRKARLTACTRQLRLPTLVVRGGRSDVVTEDAVREFLDLCPQAEYVNLAGAGHMLTGDDNDAFGRAALDFMLRSTESPLPEN
jgi:pimeloyl-ACP methyl ester carboxylesterase